MDRAAQEDTQHRRMAQDAIIGISHTERSCGRHDKPVEQKYERQHGQVESIVGCSAGAKIARLAEQRWLDVHLTLCMPFVP